ncbi:signal peptidase I [Clostridium chauvoei]|uniref:signal peptidase I n=1 Tax=Clostridium chauvoei TaxID=46867 RepID=UPI0023782C85|nr:signal peptidase I [Clostridium chauvoei]
MFYVVIVGIIVFALSPKLFGFSFYSVLSGSMTGSIDTGSIIAVKKVEASKIKKSDVITFKTGGDTVVTHRVVNVFNENGLKFATKGDANEQIDPMKTSEDNVIGKVIFHLPFLGYLIVFIQNNLVVVGITLTILIVGGYLIENFFSKKTKAEKVRI